MNTTQTRQKEKWHHLGLVLLGALVLPLTIVLAPGTLHAAAAPDGKAAVQEAYGKLPLSFEANRGQTDPQVKFLSRGPGHMLFLTPTEAVLVLSKREGPAKGILESLPKATQTVLRMAFLGANAKPRVTGQEELPGKVNYFIGNDPAKWRTHVPTYAKVHYRELYPSIDLVYYGNQRQLEYDLVVAAGADPSRIVLGFEGADRVEVDTEGDLILHTWLGEIHQRKPAVYQEVAGARHEISGGYVLLDSHTVGFQVGAYDDSQPLIIDPTLFYSTYLGGSADDIGLGIAVDAAGNAYVTGYTASANFPVTAGVFQMTLSGGTNAFVTQLNPTGSGLVYSTYLGGGADIGVGIAVDAAGNAYVSGLTYSANFPVTTGAFQTFSGGGVDAFVTTLNPTGSGLVYSTYLGGNGTDRGGGIAVDAAGNAYVVGDTDSANFPVTAGAFQTTLNGSADAFVTKLNSTGSVLLYSTYLGGSGSDGTAGFGGNIAVDPLTNAYVVGTTDSTDFPVTVGAFQTTLNGSGDAFVTKLNPTGSGLVYSTYLGGSGSEIGLGIAVDAASNAYVTGLAGGSTDFPVTTGAFQTTLGASFVTKLNPTGSGLVYSTFLNGQGWGIAVDAAGNAYVTGQGAGNLPTTPDAFQPVSGGGSDAFVMVLNPTGSGLVYSTFLGGNGNDRGQGIAVDSFNNAYVTGRTISSNFPVTAGAFQPAFGGIEDGFVAKIINIVMPPPPTVGKVTGGGTINVTGGIGNFGFIVQRQAADSSTHGDLQYHNHASGAKVHSVAFTSFAIIGNTATFGGTCTNNGVLCTFEVKVVDMGEPGTSDSFTITVDAGPPEGANENLRSGNIQIHQ